MTDYALHLAVILLIWTSLALSQGLVTGYLGILAIHQASAWAIGAYTAALLDRHFGLPLGVSAVPGALAAGILVTGATYLVARGRRDDQVVASLCVQVIFIALLINLSTITGGPNGIVNIGWGGPETQRLRALGCLAAASCLVAIAIGAYAFLHRTRGVLAWQVIRDDEDYAASLGLDAARARIQCGFLAAAIAGAAGTVFAHYATFIDPESFGLAASVAILSIAVVGRAPSVRGILLASAFIMIVPEALRWLDAGASYFANLRQAMFGLLLVAAIASRGR